MTEPMFSIIMTVGKERKFLERALTSVKRQLFTDYELVRVDDTGAGRVDSLNKAGQLAKGRFLLWLDADDSLHPAALGVLASNFAHYPDVQTIFTGWRCAVTGYHKPNLSANPRLFKAGWITCTSRDRYDEVGGFDECFPVGSTFDFRLRLHEAGGCLALDTPLYNFGDHPARISREHREEQKAAMARAVENAEERRHA